MSSVTTRSAFNPTLQATSDVWPRQRPHRDTTDGDFTEHFDLPPPPPPGFQRVAGTTDLLEPIIYDFQPCTHSETERTVGKTKSKSKKRTYPAVDTSGTVRGDYLFIEDTVCEHDTKTLGAGQQGTSEMNQVPFENIFKGLDLTVDGDGHVYTSQASHSCTDHVGSKPAPTKSTNRKTAVTSRSREDPVRESMDIDRTVDFKTERQSAMDNFEGVVEDVFYGVLPDESRHFDRVNESLFKLRGFADGKNTRLTLGDSSHDSNAEVREMKETIISYQDQLSSRSFENGTLMNDNVNLRFKLDDAKSTLKSREDDLKNAKSALSAYKTFSESLGSAYSDLSQRFTKMSKQWTKCSQTVAPLEAQE